RPAAREPTCERYRPRPLLLSLNASTPNFCVSLEKSSSPQRRQPRSNACVQMSSLGFCWPVAVEAAAAKIKMPTSPPVNMRGSEKTGEDCLSRMEGALVRIKLREPCLTIHLQQLNGLGGAREAKSANPLLTRVAHAAM